MIAVPLNLRVYTPHETILYHGIHVRPFRKRKKQKKNFIQFKYGIWGCHSMPCETYSSNLRNCWKSLLCHSNEDVGVDNLSKSVFFHTISLLSTHQKTKMNSSAQKQSLLVHQGLSYWFRETMHKDKQHSVFCWTGAYTGILQSEMFVFLFLSQANLWKLKL